MVGVLDKIGDVLEQSLVGYRFAAHIRNGNFEPTLTTIPSSCCGNFQYQAGIKRKY